MTDFIQSAAGKPDNRNERAKRAVKVFRSMQPGLTGYARAITGRRDLVVEVATGGPRTDNKKIYFRPPMSLGDNTPHDRPVCGKRYQDTLKLKCVACATREEVLISIYHEIAHIAFGTFEQVADHVKTDVIRRAIEENGTKYGEMLRKQIDHLPSQKVDNYLNLASLVSPFLPVIVNALEDARVDEGMFKARRGTKIMFDALMKSVFIEGIEGDDGERWFWKDRPLNSQALTGVFALACGYDYRDWFAEEVERALDDPDLGRIVGRISGLRSAAGTYDLAFVVLARLRELGFCLNEKEREEFEEQQPEPEPEEETQDEPADDGEEENNDDDSDSQDDSGEDAGEDEQPEDSDMGGGSDGSGDEADSDPEDDDADVPPGEEEPDSDGEPDDGGADEGESDEGSSEDSDGSEGDSEESEEDSAGSGDGVDGSEDAEGSDAGESDHGSGERDPGDDHSPESGPEGSSAPEDADQEADGSGDGDDASEEGLPDRGDAEGDGRAPSSEDLDPAGSGESGDDRSGFDGQDSDAPSGEPSDGSAGDSDGPALESDESDAESDDSEWSDRASDPDFDSADGEDGYDDVEPADTGADEGKGGTTLHNPVEYGDSNDAMRDLKVFTGHDEVQVEESPADKTDRLLDEKALDIAVIQGMYFETPSVNVTGVRVHKYGQPYIIDGRNASDAWVAPEEMDSSSLRRLAQYTGSKADLDIPESLLGPALLEMRRTFSDNQRAALQHNLKAGKIHTNALGKRAWNGDNRLFQKKRLPGKKSYAVLIGIDISGSTYGLNIALAKRAAMAQAELCHRTGVDFAIYAHTANGVWDGRLSNYSGICLDIYEIKSFDDMWNDKSKEALANISSDSENLDGHTLEFYRKAIEKVNATDKIILYYTDGKMPAANHDEELEILQREIAVCKKNQITLLGVGIRTDSPERHGLKTVQVDDDSDMVKVVRHLQTEILRRR